MVVINVDDALKEIERQLGPLEYKAPKVLCNSLNDTAKWAKQELSKEVRKNYTIRAKELKKTMSIKRARYSTLEATINTVGPVTDLRASDISAGKKTTKARVLKGGSLKELVKTKHGYNRAFVATFSNKHKAIVQRKYESDKKNPHYNDSDKSKNKDIHGKPLDVLYSNSSAKMVGSEKRVYGVVEPKIQSKLEEQVVYHIQRVLGGHE